MPSADSAEGESPLPGGKRKPDCAANRSRGVLDPTLKLAEGGNSKLMPGSMASSGCALQMNCCGASA